MQDVMFCYSVDDIGYDGYSSEEHVAKLIDNCNELGLKVTLFTVPLFDNNSLLNRKEYIRQLKRAISEGHEVAQHGLRHDRFETGVPPEFILSLPHEAPTREYLAKNKDMIDRDNSVENIRKRLAEGRKILEDSVEHKINGFRAGAGSSCVNLFKALESENYLWDSSTIIQEAGWDLIKGILDITPNEITLERFNSMQKSPIMKEFPLTTDYIWYLTKERYQPTLNLAKNDFSACLKVGIPFVNVSHVSPMFEGDNEKIGIDLYRELVDYAKDFAAENEANLSFLTMSEACDRFQG